MIVADSSPVNYLALIDAIEVLPKLFGRVLIPKEVHAELSRPAASIKVRRFAADLPDWIEVRSPLLIEERGVDAGETEAIALALENKTGILLDDRRARAVAHGLGLTVSGTLGVLEIAGERDLLDFPQALDRLQQTNFRIRPQFIAEAVERNKVRLLRKQKRQD